MSCRVDTSSLIAGACVVGDRGLGLLGSVIRAATDTGTNGPGFLYNDLTVADDAKEIRGLILTVPSSGVFVADEDGSFTLTGAANGVYTFSYRLFADGVDLGTASISITLGTSGAITAAILGTVTGTLSAAVNVSTVDVTAAILGAVTGAMSAAVNSATPPDVTVDADIFGTITGVLSARATDASGSSASAAEVWAYVLPNGMPAWETFVELHTFLSELHKVHGLKVGAPLSVTSTARNVSGISQSITDSAGVVTVTRQ